MRCYRGWQAAQCAPCPQFHSLCREPLLQVCTKAPVAEGLENLSPFTQPQTAEEKLRVLLSRLSWQRQPEKSFKAAGEGTGLKQPPRCSKQQ